jgi:hypothetical protein
MLARVTATAVCALLMLTACSSDDEPAPEPTGLIAVTTMRGALLQAAEIGPTWAPPAQTPEPGSLVSICGGTSPAPSAPAGAEVVAASFVDEGESGAQTLDQKALVYPDAPAATAGQTALRAIAETCQPTVSVLASVTDDKSEPAYTETVRVQPVDEAGWDGFVVIRHKKYEPKHPGTADTAVVVLKSRNVVLVDTYAIYQLNNASTSPAFDRDWQRLVGSVVKRVG